MACCNTAWHAWLLGARCMPRGMEWQSTVCCNMAWHGSWAVHAACRGMACDMLLLWTCGFVPLLNKLTCCPCLPLCRDWVDRVERMAAQKQDRLESGANGQGLGFAACPASGRAVAAAAFISARLGVRGVAQNPRASAVTAAAAAAASIFVAATTAQSPKSAAGCPRRAERGHEQPDQNRDCHCCCFIPNGNLCLQS